jgi:hypothetical protein
MLQMQCLNTIVKKKYKIFSYKPRFYFLYIYRKIFSGRPLTSEYSVQRYRSVGALRYQSKLHGRTGDWPLHDPDPSLGRQKESDDNLR